MYTPLSSLYALKSKDTNIRPQKQDKAPPPPQPILPEPKLSRAERKQQHQEANRQLWEAAETPKETPLFIQARAAPPPLAAATPIKQAVKVLARRPQAQATPATAQDDDPDSEEEERRRNAVNFAERQERAAREREEKQRKYAEVRERLFGSPQGGGHSPQSASPQGGNSASAKSQRPGSAQGNAARGNGRGRGRGARDAGKLYEPEYSVKPGGSAFLQRREGTRTPQSDTEKPIREPRGPDGSGRGFASRGRGG
jgi:hypothetical protein